MCFFLEGAGARVFWCVSSSSVPPRFFFFFFFFFERLGPRSNAAATDRRVCRSVAPKNIKTWSLFSSPQTAPTINPRARARESGRGCGPGWGWRRFFRALRKRVRFLLIAGCPRPLSRRARHLLLPARARRHSPHPNNTTCRTTNDGLPRQKKTAHHVFCISPSLTRSSSFPCAPPPTPPASPPQTRSPRPLHPPTRGPRCRCGPTRRRPF